MFLIGLGASVLIIIFHGKGGKKYLDIKNPKSVFDPDYVSEKEKDEKIIEKKEEKEEKEENI